jgi:tetratricopeptide (TPR) repeat protein
MKFLLANACLCCALIFILFTSGCMTNAENPNNEDMTYFMEETNESQEYYDDLVASDPSNATAWCIRGMYYNNCYGQYTEAMESCNKALELDPEYGVAWYLKGVILVNTNKRDEATLCFENATKYDPELTKYLPFISDKI